MKTLLLVFFSLLIAGPVWSNDYHGSCGITFQGSSTLHDFSGTVPCQPFTLAVPASGEVQAGKVSVAVAQMNTDNSARDKKLRGMFDHQKFPLIIGDYAGFNFEDTVRKAIASAPDQNSFDFNLRIRDIERPVHAALRHLKKEPQGLSFTLQFDLSLADFQLRPPSVLGLIRVADTVTVLVDVTLQEPPTPSGATAQ